MDQYQRTLRAGAAALACAIVFRLMSGGLADKLLRWLSDPENQSFLLYLETGRVVHPTEVPPSVETQPPTEIITQPPTEPPAVQTMALPSFSASDMSGIDIRYSCDFRPDMEKLLTQSLNWNLQGDQPTVLILHTHTTESYTKSKGENYKESSHFRTLDEHYNMVSIGDRVAEYLTQQGISVIHDRELHDYPSYNGSYTHSRNAAAEYLEKYPSIRLILDLHRDASGDIDNQMRTHAKVDGKDCAQLMVVIGTNATRKHPNWEENLALGLKLHAQLERIAPGVTRPLTLREQRFNQDLITGALLIEVGAAGNTHEEALRAADVLAEAIIQLSRGSE